MSNIKEKTISVNFREYLLITERGKEDVRECLMFCQDCLRITKHRMGISSGIDHYYCDVCDRLSAFMYLGEPHIWNTESGECIREKKFYWKIE